MFKQPIAIAWFCIVLMVSATCVFAQGDSQDNNAGNDDTDTETIETESFKFSVKTKTGYFPSIYIEYKSGTLDLSLVDEGRLYQCLGLWKTIFQSEINSQSIRLELVRANADVAREALTLSRQLERLYQQLGCDDVIASSLVNSVEQEIMDKIFY